MSYEQGMAAICLEMPGQVPRTEYSADSHWDLVKKTTGIDVSAENAAQIGQTASGAFVKAWDYGMYWNVLTKYEIFGDKRTKMGHAVYESGGGDYSGEVSALFEDPEDVFSYDMFEAYGTRDQELLIQQYNNDYENQRAMFPDAVAMTGIYVTCMSGLIELLGWDILLCAAGTDTKAFGEFTDRYCTWILQYFEALAKSVAPVVMVHDDIVWGNGAFLHPDFYRRYIFPNYKKLLRPLHESGKKILYTSDGDYTQFIDDIAKCGINGFVLEPGTDMEYIAQNYGKTHAFVGNADTNVLLLGDKSDIRAEVERCMKIGKSCPGFIMAVGNHIPSNTPVDNALYYDEIYRKLSKR